MGEGSDGLAGRVAATVVAWDEGRHPAGPRDRGGDHVRILDELLVVVTHKMADHQMDVVLGQGSRSDRLSDHIARALEQEMLADREFERHALGLLIDALEIAVRRDSPAPDADRFCGAEEVDALVGDLMDDGNVRWNSSRSSSTPHWLSRRSET